MFFTPQSTPRVFGLPVGCDFAQGFVEGLRARLKNAAPESRARVMILVNTRRAQRRLETLLAGGGAGLQPDIRVISDLGNGVGVPAAQARFLRHLALADLVGAFLEAQPELAPKTAMFGLAETLADLQDEMASEDVGFEALAAIKTQHLSAHWQRNLDFLAILNTYQAALPAEMLTGAEARQRAAVEAQLARWQAKPPQHPVIVAGSTGSRAVTAMLMQAVATLPQGAVVLPGYDYTTPTDLWGQLGEEHPQFGFAELSGRVGFDPAALPLWFEGGHHNPARNALVSLALRPAPITPHWLAEAPKLAKNLPVATQNLTLLSAPDARHEAMAIAVRLREAVALGQKAALVTPDRNLTRRVAAELSRWGITPDDSAGHPAKLTPPGVFLRMVATALGAAPTPVNLMEILKHPLCAAGVDSRQAHLSLARRFERKALRAGPVQLDLAGFDDWKDKNKDGAVWLARLHTVFTPLRDATPRPLFAWAKLHRKTAEQLAGAALWEKEAGNEVAKVFETLGLGESHASLYSAPQYRALFTTVLERLEVPADPLLAHPDIAIWGTLEARLQSPDLVIAAGLNEGIWPKVSGHDPWLNRDMRRQVGLMLPERQIGLSAHDFQQAMGAAEVVISRSLRDGEAPSVASRWLLRLQNLLGGMEGGENALKEMSARGDRLLALASVLDRPAGKPQPAKRPCPAPPVAARPRRLSVTRIETLIRDPYAIYASQILTLRPLEPLTAEPSPILRGNVVHKALELFGKQSMGGLPNAPESLYDQCVEEALQEVPWPATRALWRHHLMQARGFFLEGEAERRQQGAPFGLEISGVRIAKGPVFDTTLTAKADRIDISPSGGALIYDYKAGSKESAKQIKAFKVQLPLEGAIAEAQGFTDLKASHVAGLSLIYLGNDPAVISFEADDPVMDDVWQRVVGFLATFQGLEKGYAARLRPELSSFDGDYDHLARRGEWQDDDQPLVEVIP